MPARNLAHEPAPALAAPALAASALAAPALAAPALATPCFNRSPQSLLQVGGLFRRFSELPTFTLHSTGHGPDFVWRQYQLRASGMTCEINETFPKSLFDAPAPLPPQIEQGNHYGGF